MPRTLRTPPPRRRLALGLALALLGASALLASCGSDAPPRWAEEDWTYAVSVAVFQAPEGRSPTEALVRAREAMRHVESGTSFEEIVRTSSDDKSAAAEGGFVGFVLLREESSFVGALQVLKEGEVRGPVLSNERFVLIRRHPFEEARALERRYRVPLYGLMIGWRELRDGPNRSKEEAKALADTARARLVSGEWTLDEARANSGATGKPTGFLGMAHPARPGDPVWDSVRDLPVGTWGPVVEAQWGYAVVRKEPLLRAFVRHAVIRHIGAQGRELSLRRTREEALALAGKALEEAAADGSNWPEIVRKYSDEVETIPVEGSLGAIGNGDLHPVLEQALLETEPGRVVSKVVESPGGFHVLFRVN